MRTLIVVPARLASTRLPEKPLQIIEGKPLVQRTYEAAMRVPSVSGVLVAADDPRIVEVVRSFGGEAVLTAVTHPTGTDRLTEILRTHDADLYVNLQCDEPLVRPDDIARLVEGMRARSEASCGTLFHAIDAHEAARASVVKVVVGARDEALYFSRSPIPFARNPEHARYRKHVGIYAYRRTLLERYPAFVPPPEELAESLEQLRLLHAGERMLAFEIAPTGPGVDTPEDLEAVRRVFRRDTVSAQDNAVARAR